MYGIHVDSPSNTLLVDLLHEKLCRNFETLKLQKFEFSEYFEIRNNFFIFTNSSLSNILEKRDTSANQNFVSNNQLQNFGRLFLIKVIASTSSVYQRVITIQAEVLPK